MITFLFFFVIICRFKVLIELHLYLKTIIKLENLLFLLGLKKQLSINVKNVVFEENFYFFLYF